MDDYPCWGELGPADHLRIAALEAALAGVAEPILEAIHEVADILEQVAEREERDPKRPNSEQNEKKPRKYPWLLAVRWLYCDPSHQAATGAHDLASLLRSGRNVDKRSRKGRIREVVKRSSMGWNPMPLKALTRMPSRARRCRPND